MKISLVHVHNRALEGHKNNKCIVKTEPTTDLHNIPSQINLVWSHHTSIISWFHPQIRHFTTNKIVLTLLFGVLTATCYTGIDTDLQCGNSFAIDVMYFEMKEMIGMYIDLLQPVGWSWSYRPAHEYYTIKTQTSNM